MSKTYKPFIHEYHDYSVIKWLLETNGFKFVHAETQAERLEEASSVDKTSEDADFPPSDEITEITVYDPAGQLLFLIFSEASNEGYAYRELPGVMDYYNTLSVVEHMTTKPEERTPYFWAFPNCQAPEHLVLAFLYDWQKGNING